ncbi:MAG: SIMPL domain-containing protein [Pseudomonadota bacterium]|nr:SIMPL domain-containing protein [Pseudomonadota bacterium]
MKPVVVMMRASLLWLLWLLPTAALYAQPAPARESPSVTVSASANASVANDRVQAWLRAEAENADAAAAANQVNATIGKALARARAVPDVMVSTSGYSTQQISEKARPQRWRVVQTILLTGSDFGAISNLLTRMQAEDALLLSGMAFSLSPAARARAESQLLQEAVRGWQARCQTAATALGFASWRVGNVSVQTSEPGRAYPIARMASAMAADTAPVSIEAGLTEVSVTVSGDALLEAAKAR